MSPHVHHTDSKYGIWWRRWVGTIALVAVVIVGVAGFIKVEAEGNLREKQFCGLVVNGFEEKQNRIAATKKFLSTPDDELPGSLVDLKSYIRNVSLPQTVKELDSEEETLPGVCWKYYDKKRE